MPSLESRIRGSIYGITVADALGGPVEFHARGSFPPVTDYRYNDNFDLPPGSWTDDTSLTLCLAQSLIDKKGAFDAADQVSKYIEWHEKGYMSVNKKCFDIGNATRIALVTWKDHLRTGEGDLASGQYLVNRSLKRKNQCGNGSLMRVAPIGLVYYQNPAVALANSVLSSQVTHPYPTNSEACKIYTQLIVRTLESASKEEIASNLISYAFDDPDLRSRFAKYSDLASFESMEERRISSYGYVVDSLEASLWAFFTTSTFEQGALKVVNLGHDADTVGAIYGGLAGAFYGIENVPQKWISGLENRETIEAVAEGLVALVAGGPHDGDSTRDF
ncbi:MAG: hypothetical protein HETSPECPRED_003967 [Heterodermia speciosa]|uniref:ADP-ribosylhydrolase ARH3 n=1 Tax=Heterodermia speciosa TaxID=116794 RepID=A0A8H3IMK4_9LECA|nr:MAG: hypothetical protein HETSPECPRED_003967 [Heterodermia speciosa]